MKFTCFLMVFGMLTACAASTRPKDAPPEKETLKPIATATDGHTTAAKITAIQKQGYKIVNRDGQTLYCRTEKKTGTQITRETVCMTEKETESLRDLTQRRMDEFVRQRPPPQGK